MKRYGIMPRTGGASFFWVRLFLFCALTASVLGQEAMAEHADDDHAALEECAAHSQAGRRECLVQQARASSAALEQAESQLRSVLAQWDEDAERVRRARTQLDVAGKKFIEYRDAHCAFDASLGGGAIGNALEMRRLACVVELNTRRAQQLRRAAADLRAASR